MKRELKRENFARAILSGEFKFSEVLKYGKYLNEETEYITMHKTKGTSIDSVVVVMEEFYWSQYKFDSIYSNQCDSKAERASNSRKLIYVACSRARKFLAIVRILENTEVESFLKCFPTAEEFPIEE
ncbi:MAG: 3'-5' exonuclease [Flavonifractor plautii]|nr:3'-5' exonuclease [Flavonifractor plautii]